jgi:hypothetical protein
LLLLQLLHLLIRLLYLRHFHQQCLLQLRLN